VLALVLSVGGRLQRTKLETGGVYKLESQHDGAYLTAFGNGKVGTKQDTGGADQGQKWTFTQQGEGLWTMAPLIQDLNLVTEQTWKVIPVNHGKSLLQSSSTGMCLQNSRSEVTLLNGNCDRDEPKQRWNIQPAASA
jgi:hypothetical protein